MGVSGGCERIIEVFVKTKKKKNWGVGRGVGSGGRVGGGGVRVDVNEELKFLGKFKKKIGGGVRGCWFGGQDGCERRIEVFVKIQKKIGGGGHRGEGVGLGVRWM